MPFPGMTFLPIFVPIGYGSLLNSQNTGPCTGQMAQSGLALWTTLCHESRTPLVAKSLDELSPYKAIWKIINELRADSLIPLPNQRLPPKGGAWRVFDNLTPSKERTGQAESLDSSRHPAKGRRDAHNAKNGGTRSGPNPLMAA